MRFVRENRQMINKKLYCEDVLQMLFADSDSEGEYLRSKCCRQTVQVQSVWVGLCAVPCNKRYHTLKDYKRSPRYLIGQIADQLIKK